MRIKGTTHTTTTLPALFTSISGNSLTISPTNKAEIGTYEVELIVTPNYASAAPYTYHALTLTVGCVITSV